MKKDAKDAKAIPITSIIGSSAGGMIALAISTGIEPHEVEKICYRMSAIPSTDRFVWQDIKSGSGK
jgi:predicted acylesterase/phospholipase RssA